MDNMSDFVTLMEENSSSRSGGTDWRFWSDFGHKLELKYKYSDAVDDELISVLTAYETIWAKKRYSELSSNFYNFANDILASFEEPFKHHKLKSSAYGYIQKITEHLLTILEMKHHIVEGYFMVPSLKILSDYVDEKGDALIKELFKAGTYLKDLLAINLVNCQFPGPLTIKYNGQAKQLLSSGKNPLIIEAMKYYRFDKGSPDNEIVTTITSFLHSQNFDLQWNALAFFETHIDHAKLYIQEGVIEKLLKSGDEGVAEKARQIFSKLSQEKNT